MSPWLILTTLFLLFLTVWRLPYIGGSWLLIGGSFLYNDISEAASRGPRKILVLLVSVAVFVSASFWQRQVTELVPEPYLDEIFHIPQAQAYCNGEYDIWDPKLTTPPGLYAFSTFFMNILGRMQCSVWNLRIFSTTVLVAAMAYACDCRGLIIRTWKRDPTVVGSEALKLSQLVSPIALHTAVNVALFPPMFFFSGLYYTDVLSTCVVIRVFRAFLQRKGAYTNSTEGSIWIYLGGIVALTMRQTNIFWVAIFMGGLEAVRTIKMNAKPVDQSPEPQTMQELTISAFNQYIHGNIYDIPLMDAGVHDFALCTISIVIAVIYRPILILTRLWPYIALLISFAAFVLWNGGVVLGDKSNHVATIHLPQLLYLWPFIAFFSWPLLLSPALSLLQYASETINYLIIPSPIPKLPTLRKLAFLAAYTAVALLATLLVIHFNTIIHPFTLADNRHYVFYVFRYTILRHSLIRYLLAPIYLACFYLVYLSLAGSSPLSSSLQNFKGPRRIFQVPNPRHHIRIRKGEWEGPNTSFFLIWILSTALSLITAPLVEPRYFILPWVLWRLHLPSLSTPSSFTYTMPGPAPPPSSSEYSRSSSAAFAKRFSQYTSGPETMELTQPAPPPQSAEQRAAEGKVNAIIESQNPNGEENLHAAGVPVPTQTQTQTQRAAHGLVLSSSIPTLSSSSTWPSSPSERGARSQSSDAATSSASEKEDGGLETMSDYALWIETLWFLVINAVTGYIFLYWGFEWASEPGAVQRFMW